MRDHSSLLAWQEAKKVTSEVLDLSETRWTPPLGAIWGQLQRSSLSVQLNIAEGYALGTAPLFTKHIRIAYGSAVETGELPTMARCQRSQRLLLGLLRRKSG